MEYTEKIIASINRLMASQGSAIISLCNSVFALDSDLHFGEVWSIPRAKLILPDQFRRVIALIIEDGPSWIHSNLVSTSDHKFLILKGAYCQPYTLSTYL
jgi:hypothetical protein